jgi:hypothetical protein
MVKLYQNIDLKMMAGLDQGLNQINQSLLFSSCVKYSDSEYVPGYLFKHLI